MMASTYGFKKVDVEEEEITIIIVIITTIINME